MPLSTVSVFSVLLLLYLAVLILVSFLARREATEAEFLVASRSIGPWVGGAVLTATQLSAGAYIGGVGRHYLTGTSWLWIFVGIWSGWLVSALWVAPKLREFGGLTVPEILGVRYDNEWVRTLSSILIIVGYSVYLVAQFQAIGEIGQIVYGISPKFTVLVIVVIIVLYTGLGGVRLSSYVTLFHTLFMVFGALIAVPLVLHRIGGLNLLGKFLTDLDPRITGWWYGWKELLAFSFAFGFHIAAAPYEMTRYYSMRDKATVRYAIGVSFLFQFVIGLSLALAGLMVRFVYPSLASPDQASILLAFKLLPPLSGSLFLIAILSSIMSTCNAILIVTSGAFSHDVYCRLFKRQATDRERIFVARLAMAVLACIPIWFALQRYTDIQTIIVVTLKLVASFFFVPVVIGLNWKRGTAAGAIAAMAVGFLGCLLWEFQSLLVGSPNHWWRHLDAVEGGVGLSALAFVAVSWRSRPARQSVLDRFFKKRA